jgi:hypothetical protein
MPPALQVIMLTLGLARLARFEGPTTGFGLQGIAGNKKGEFEVEAQFLANYIQTMVRFS